MDKKYLQENVKAKRVLKYIGFISLIFGIILSISGFSSVFNDMDANNVYLIFIGFPLIFIGIVCLNFAYMGKVSRYTASEIAPVAKDTINYMIDGTKDEVVDLFHKIKESPGSKKICPYCGDENDSDAIYCDHCGVKLKKTCTCGAENQSDSRYCKKCGREL